MYHYGARASNSKTPSKATLQGIKRFKKGEGGADNDLSHNNWGFCIYRESQKIVQEEPVNPFPKVAEDVQKKKEGLFLSWPEVGGYPDIVDYRSLAEERTLSGRKTSWRKGLKNETT